MTASRCSTGRSRSPTWSPTRSAAGGRARPRRARVPGRAARPRRAAGPAGHRQGGWQPAYPGLPDYMVNHQRKPGIGPLSGWRGEDGDKTGVGAPNPDQLKRYIENGGFSCRCIAPEDAYFKHANAATSTGRSRRACSRSPSPRSSSSISSRCASSSLPRRGKGIASRPSITARGSRPVSTRCPSGIRRSRAGSMAARLSAARHHPAPDAHVSFLGLAECLAAADPRRERALCPRRCLRRGRPVGDGDWALVTSHMGEIRVKPGARMDAVNGTTLWTWNAIGKRGRLGARTRTRRRPRAASCSTI
jgi:hypothetical protein